MTDTDTGAKHARKEEIYQQLQETGKKIAGHINELKDRREKRNALTASAQEHKTTRKELSKVIKDKIVSVKDLRSKLPDRPATPAPVQQSHGNRGGRGGDREERMTPSKMKEEIARIELKLETSAMPFTEEQKLSKILKEKKAQLAKMGGDTDLERDVRTRSKEIDKLKRESDVAHESVTKAAKESQEHHEVILKLSKEIEDLKKFENTLREEYTKLKTELQGSAEMPELPGKKISRSRQRSAPQQHQMQSAEDKQVIQEKAAEVEQKVKDKKKLTTEDLLAFQAHK